MSNPNQVADEVYQPRLARRSVRHAVRGVDYHVSEWGDPAKPLLLMLHGFGDAGSTFQFLVDQLQNDWFVVAPDWRGFGESRLRAQSYWFPDYVADLEMLLSIYSPDQPVNLLGHSMGGNIAGLFAGIFPERVSKFINVEGFGLADRKPDDAPLNYRRWIETSRQGETYRSYESFDQLAKRILRQSPAMPMPMAIFVAQQWAEQDEGGRVTIKADPAHKLPNAVLYRRSEAEVCWSQVSAPVLFVLGADSKFRPGAVPWLATEAAVLPFSTAKLVTVEGAGHMVQFEQPAALAALVEDFLTSGTNGSDATLC